MTIANLLATPVVDTLAKTLLHSLWQGATVALAVMMFLRMLRNAPAVARYRLSCAGLALAVLLPLLTFANLNFEAERSYRMVGPSITAVTLKPAVTEAFAETSSVSATPVSSFAPPASFSAPEQADWLPYLVIAWLLGVVLLSVRLLGGFILSRRFKRTYTRAVTADLSHKLHLLSKRLEVKRPVTLLESLTAPVPLVVGWLKPVVLLPTSALSGLTPEQLEMVLAHELAHVRRNDYLINLLQTVAETLLFYHPAIWWLSKHIRDEREHCCDDLAVALCGDRLSYARTLARLDELTNQNQPANVSWPKTALAITGGSLLKRIQRLANRPDHSPKPLTWLLGLGLLLIPVLVVSIATAQAKLPVQIEANIDTFVEDRLSAWTVPGMQVAVLQKGDLTFSKGYGLANVDTATPMTADTPVPLGSASWLVNAVATLSLVEDGSLNLDSTLTEVLPWVQFSDNEETEITIGDLLFGGANVRDTVRFEGVQHSQIVTPRDSDFDTLGKEALIRSLMPDRLHSNLGQHLHADYHYVLNDVLLALVLETASGQAHEALLAETVFEPLEISASYAPVQTNTYRLTSSYSTAGPQDMVATPINPPEALASVVGLSLSSRDLANLLQAFLTKDERLLSQESWDTLLTPDTNGWGAGGWSTRFIRATQFNEGQTVFANIGGTEGSEVFIEVIPETATAYLTMTNYAIPNDRHPLYQVLGSMAVALRLFDEPDAEADYNLDKSKETDFGAYFSERMAGNYASALGTIRLYAEGDVLKGDVLGHEVIFKSVGSTSRVIMRSDYAPLNEIYVSLMPQGINLLSRQFAFKLE